jgi:hypothetical protein
MSKQYYKEKLRSPKWQKKRLEIFNRDEFTCQQCQDTETTLNVHHLKYTKYNIWEEPNENLITVCEHCHYELEKLKIKDVSNINDDIIIRKLKRNNERVMFLAGNNKIFFIHYINNEVENHYLFNDSIEILKDCINFIDNKGGKNG